MNGFVVYEASVDNILKQKTVLANATLRLIRTDKINQEQR